MCGGRHRRVAIALVVFACGLAACGEDGYPAEASVASAVEIGAVSQPDIIQGRDGSGSALLWGRSVWQFGDTALWAPDAAGSAWHHNSYGIAESLDASVGISLDQYEDDAGAPLYLVPPTAEEAAYNAAHAGDACEEAPCGARWAAWPDAMVFDAARDRALVFYGLVYATTENFDFTGVGNGIATWPALDAPAERPEVSPGAEHPTLMFGPDEPGYGIAAIVDTDDLYAFACTQDGARFRCSLARVSLADALDRGSWRYWNGNDWSDEIADAATLFDGGTSLTVSYNRHLQRWTAIYSAPIGNDVDLRTAPSLTGPWSNPLRLFVADRKGDTGWTYDAAAHPELEGDDGRVQYVTFSRPSGDGWFESELALVRIELE
jgi:hypothetical protein